MKKYSSLLLAVVGSLVVSHVSESAVFTDDFSVAHNYLTDGVGGTIWSGVMFGENAGQLNSNISTAGNLTIQQSVETGWDVSHHNAPYLYIDVTGDYSAVLAVTSSTGAAYSVPMLLAMGDLTNFVAMNQSQYFGTYSSRVQVNGVDTDTGGPNFVLPSTLRLDRVGNTYTTYYSNDGGANYTLLTTYTAPDGSVLANAAGKIGISYGGYTPQVQQGDFDSFTLTTAVPEPSTYALLLGSLGVVALLVRRRVRA